MKIVFLKKEKEQADYNIISTITDKISEFETELVDIHCSLNSSIRDLGEFRMLQERLDTLTTKYYMDKNSFEDVFKDLQRRFERYGAILKNNALIAIFALIIPYIGLILGLTIECFNLIYLKKVKDDLKYLGEYSDYVETKFNIIKTNIEIKYDFLNSKLKEYANKKNRVELDYDDDYTFYYANQILSNYLKGHDVAIEDIDPKIILAMKCMLQIDLKSDCDDLMKLLNDAKRESLENSVEKVKKLN